MGLTKPRAYQIYDIDYKQAVRVVTTTNITLAGGAPNSVDGVTLSLNDRVLVTGQSTGSQNGIYYVTTLGTGANGTWARSVDGNETGEILAGMIIMVTEGTSYADTQWKLTTNDPIVIGTTSLTFVLAVQANLISSGNSNVVVNSNANVTVSSGGTANVLVISSTGTVTTGTASATGNITGGNIRTAGLISATGTVTGSSFIGAVASSTTVSATGNITGGNVLTGGQVSATGNITGGNLLVTEGDFTTATATGNIIGGNLLTGGQVSATGNVTGGNIRTAGLISATGNVNANYFVGNGSALTGIVASAGAAITNGTSNVTVAASSNVTTGVGGSTIQTVASTGVYVTGVVSASGNVTGSYILGNGALLTGVITSVANINSGTSNVTVVSSGGNIAVGVGGTSNVAVFATTGEYVTGVVSASGNITSAANISGSYILGNGSALTGLPAGYTNANLATVGANVFSSTANVTTTANISGGNLLTGGLISAASTITGTSYLGSIVSVTANITGGNVLTGGLISAASTVTGTSHLGAVVSVTGNVTGGNVLTAVLYTNTGNTTGSAIVNSGANGVGNIGSATGYFNTAHVKATSAQYADLAEMYVADNHYQPGTVVEFGGEQEVTITTRSHSTSVAGIVSTNPSYLMNSCQEGEHVVAVALTGRVPCQVLGPVKKGDVLVSSNLPGVAQRIGADWQPGVVLGKSLETIAVPEVQTIEVAVGRL